jgi:hypothetical protein
MIRPAGKTPSAPGKPPTVPGRGGAQPGRPRMSPAFAMQPKGEMTFNGILGLAIVAGVGTGSWLLWEDWHHRYTRIEGGTRLLNEAADFVDKSIPELEATKLREFDTLIFDNTKPSRKVIEHFQHLYGKDIAGETITLRERLAVRRTYLLWKSTLGHAPKDRRPGYAAAHKVVRSYAKTIEGEQQHAKAYYRAKFLASVILIELHTNERRPGLADVEASRDMHIAYRNLVRIDAALNQGSYRLWFSEAATPMKPRSNDDTSFASNNAILERIAFLTPTYDKHDMDDLRARRAYSQEADQQTAFHKALFGMGLLAVPPVFDVGGRP